MKVNEWGFVVEPLQTLQRYEIKLSEALASKVYNYIEKVKANDEQILSG